MYFMTNIKVFIQQTHRASELVVTATQKVRLLLRLDLWAEVTTSKAESKLITTGCGAQFVMIPGISKTPPLYVGSCYSEMHRRP